MFYSPEQVGHAASHRAKARLTSSSCATMWEFSGVLLHRIGTLVVMDEIFYYSRKAPGKTQWYQIFFGP